MENFKERINYVVKDGYCVGSAVNLPIVCQGKDLDELKKRIKIMAKMWVDDMKETIEKDLFEFTEEKTLIAYPPNTLTLMEKAHADGWVKQLTTTDSWHNPSWLEFKEKHGL